MKRLALSAATVIFAAAVLMAARAEGTSAQLLVTPRPPAERTNSHLLRGVVERGVVRAMPAAPASTQERCPPHICCRVVYNRQCDGNSCVYASWHGHGCGRKYTESGSDAGCCNVILV